MTILELGPSALVIKRGEHGALAFLEGGERFALPALPLRELADPTGAGDTFAGGFMGYLASAAQIDDGTVNRAMIAGSAIASFAVEDFGLERLLRLTPAELRARFTEFTRLTHFEPL